MLYLSPPYRVIDGHAVFPDHADPRLFYVLPQMPSLRATPEGLPELSLVQYLGGGAGSDRIEGGFLTLTLELGIEEDVLATLREKLADSLEGPGPDGLTLTPVLFDDGVVEIIALGRSSSEVDEEEGSGPTEPESAGPFEIAFLGSRKPSLGGSNAATFQLILDANAAEFIERTLDAPATPIIVLFRVVFSGLRESFEVDVQADWGRVYHKLQQRLQMNLYYAAADVESNVTSALEDSGIRIETDVFGTGEADRAAAARAREHLLEWVMGRLFEPVIDPGAATAAGVGDAIDATVSSLVRAVVPGASYRLRQVDETQLRLMSARMRESVAERREVVPQGTLGMLLARYREDEDGTERPEWSDLRDSLVQRVNLSGFPRLEVEVAVEDRFAADGLSQVIVEMARMRSDETPTDERVFTFRSADEREHYIVNLLGADPADFDAPYRYRSQVHFDPQGPYGPHDPVWSAWRTGRTTELFVDPRGAYLVREISVGVTPTFSFDLFPAVDVQLREAGDGGEATARGRVRLEPAAEETIWRFRSFADRPPPYEYSPVYYRDAAVGGNIEVDWRPEIEDYLSIPDPMPRKRHLNLFVNLPWNELVTAFLRVRYADEANGIDYDEQIDLTPDERFVSRVYSIADEGPIAISYRLTLFLTTGQLLEGQWRITEEDRLVLDRRLVEERVVNVRTMGGRLEDHGLSEVRLDLEVREDGGRLRHEATLTIGADGAAPDPWEFLLGDPPIRTVHFSALFIDRDGFTNRTSWRSTDSDLLVVRLANQSVSA